MPQTVLEMAKDLVKVLVEAGQLTPDQMPAALQAAHASLLALQARQARLEAGEGSARGSPIGALDWRQSITRHAITCLECGSVYKQLQGRHLHRHGLNGRTYRAKYGIPQSQPLAARDTTARRRQAVQEIRPWEKSPRYVEGRAARVAAAAKQRSGAAKRRRAS